MRSRSRPSLCRSGAIVVLALSLVLAGACRGEEGVPLTLASEDGGDEFVPVDYDLTSETYKKWLVAQENLKRDAGDADLGLPAQRVLLTNPSAGSIDSVVDELESVEQTRKAKGRGKGRGKGKS